MRLLIILFLTAVCVSAQTPDKISIKKEPADTIDYTYLLNVKGFVVDKVIQGQMQVRHLCYKDISFMIIKDLRSWNYNGLQSQVKSSDTLIRNMSWYITKDNSCYNSPCYPHLVCGKVRLNRKTNILIIEKCVCTSDPKKLKLLFRVIKLSEYEMVLEDLQNDYGRRYYFRRMK